VARGTARVAVNEPATRVGEQPRDQAVVDVGFGALEDAAERDPEAEKDGEGAD